MLKIYPYPETSMTTDENSTTTAQLAIEAPERSRPDEQIPVRITGAPAGETVQFEASMDDASGTTWRSQATFTADSKGRVDLTTDSPESGSYDGVRPIGWLWSMTAADEDQLVTEFMHTETTTVRLRATAGDETAERRIERGFEGEPITRSEVATDDFVGTVFEPDEEGTHPGVLVLHGSGGHSPVFEAALLASHGFAAFALQYIGEPDILSEEIQELPVTYFDTAAEWFLSAESVTGKELGLVGHSRGAEIGLWLSANRNWAGPVISYVGSSVLWNTPTEAPAWLDKNGAALPFVSGKGKPTLCEGQLDEADDETIEAATVPVEDIDGPVLFITGEQDPIWPARRLADMAVDRLEQSDFEYSYDHLTYDDAGHFITPPYLPKSHRIFGGTPGGMACADSESWPVVLDYLSEGLDADGSGH
jgi:dienelactone hydrolase